MHQRRLRLFHERVPAPDGVSGGSRVRGHEQQLPAGGDARLLREPRVLQLVRPAVLLQQPDSSLQTGPSEISRQKVNSCKTLSQTEYKLCRNVTIQDVKWEQQCDQVEVTRKDCRTEIETRERTVKTQKCHQYEDEVCVNYNVPSYEVVRILRKRD